MNTQTVNVDLGDRSYKVHIGAGLLDSIGTLAAGTVAPCRCAVMVDSAISRLYADRAMESLKSAGFSPVLIQVPTGEANKTVDTFSHLLDELFAITPAIDRGTVVFALGGGVTGDMCGYAAASALRGLQWFQVPTTLLADVDSSVGGKTGINHPVGKNLIGAFHQPAAVFADVETLKSLPTDEIRNGLGECVKHAVIRDATLLDFIQTNAQAILDCDSEIMCDLVARNVAIKAQVVAADEREAGVRAHLNFGHTIGHAIESLAGYGVISHGQGVSLGMVAAGQMAVDRGLIGSDVQSRIKTQLQAVGLPVSRSGLDSDEIWRIMQHDKKARGGKVKMVLPLELGKVEIYDDITAGEAAAAVAALKP